MEPSNAAEDAIRKRAVEMEQFYPRIVGCHVVFEQAHRRQQQGRLFHVRIELNVPGKKLSVDREGKGDHAHEDPYVAIRDAFDAARRQLEDFGRRQSGRVKTRAEPSAEGRVRMISWYEGFGFIETPGHDDVYFHKNAVRNADFESLEVGQRVRFVLNEGESLKGPQASSVERVA
jgi:cold shock CspA family protein/ribosome-associated translation inhibitor RaiA